MPIRGSIANSLRSFGGDRVGRDIPEVKTGVIDYFIVAGGGVLLNTDLTAFINLLSDILVP